MGKEEGRMGKGQRKKGHDYERYIRNRFHKLDEAAVRNYEYLPGADLGHDVEACGYLVQCKRGKRYAPVSKIFEVKSTKGIPLLITKEDRRPDIVCIFLDAFMELLEEKKNGVEEIQRLQQLLGEREGRCDELGKRWQESESQTA